MSAMIRNVFLNSIVKTQKPENGFKDNSHINIWLWDGDCLYYHLHIEALQPD